MYTQIDHKMYVQSNPSFDFQYNKEMFQGLLGCCSSFSVLHGTLLGRYKIRTFSRSTVIDATWKRRLVPKPVEETRVQNWFAWSLQCHSRAAVVSNTLGRQLTQSPTSRPFVLQQYDTDKFKTALTSRSYQLRADWEGRCNWRKIQGF